MFESDETPNGALGGAPARSLRGRTHRTTPPPSCSNTRETNKAASRYPQGLGIEGVALDGSEKVRITERNGHQHFEAIPLPNQDVAAGVAIIDYLAFSWSPPDLLPAGGRVDPVRRIYERLQEYLSVPLTFVGTDHGGNGYKHHADLKLASGLRCGWIQWGGDRQRGTVHVELTGEGCAKVDDWQAFQDWLEVEEMRITRADAAYDDLQGETFSMEKVRDMYLRGDFNCGGRAPAHNVQGDWFIDGSPKGRTFYVGHRQNGKMVRFYEKGKQLGDGTSPWVRVELEFRAKNRIIPYDVLTLPGNYLAGSYPTVLGFLSIVQERIRTITKAAQISLDKAIENGRQLVGKLIHVMMQVAGGDAFEVVNQLKRDGFPSRLLPFADNLPCSFAGGAT